MVDGQIGIFTARNRPLTEISTGFCSEFPKYASGFIIIPWKVLRIVHSW